MIALVLAGLLAALETPEERAILFLSREVPRWSRENGCFSCHNNGDAAQALFEGVKSGLVVSAEATADTLSFLARPGSWDDNRGEAGFDDVTLARIQFATALVRALEAGLLEEPAALSLAADLVRSDQSEDGSWTLDESASIGSPATYGRVLATAAARRVLVKAGGGENTQAVTRADEWLRDLEVKTVLDAAALLLGLEGAGDPEAAEKRRLSLDIIIRGEAPSGGWGPYLVSAAEPFDTALVILALVAEDRKTWAEPIARGRAYLLESQLADGSWPETTRPRGQQSYAQYISTAGWAARALIATANPR
jgi:hypothetical protein